MSGIIQSELLKMRHTFSMKLVFTAPLTAALLGYLLSGSFAQLSTYNWWYTILLPVVVAMWAAGMIVREKNTGMQNVVCLPVRFDKIWLGKTLTLAIMLFGMHLLLWLITTVMGLLAGTAVSPPDGLIGCMLLFLTYLWQIPFIMLLAGFMGYLPAVFGAAAASVLLSAFGTEKAWFLLNPYAIPARIVCPFFKIHHNGLPLNNSSPLLFKGPVLPALAVSLLLALLVYLCSSKLFRKGGGGCA
ncbi:lantibiotic immunity ABC transporter MutE/EpiE family permease subunit [Diplocloster agilis]|uniref:Lantibiotic immunity ABC transporter MutE/EpiE family permease subunit n=1 Tax=Diplocloster agilis TaxID=2850323 RepID=A0A949K8C9_9FIRM|nr:lantibiotic immunity ABC transporter MutE/EpiE family permease subunit [Diplocloster agilis]MBU9738097.1 lantibiotic immunity ABC transporter MutE/EpiE family permease subunit [Diplocloster agilis]